ncbi:TPA: DNA polymerase II large subunit, partial [Candidatus Micrarchaeota archaeon]|nr:DNA polymerase II large subunit [Candidatus Micrarchaeota archaeon]
DAPAAFEFSGSNEVPLHPDYTYPWHDVTNEQLRLLVDWLKTGSAVFEEGRLRFLSLDVQKEPKRVLEELLVEHRIEDGRVVLGADEAFTTLSSLGMLEGEKLSSEKFDAQWIGEKDPLELVNLLSGIKVKAKAPTYIGARMGRPEKAKERKMDGAPQVMFPTGSFKNRSLMKIYRSMKAKEGEKTINLEVARFRCPGCNALSFYRRCTVCGKQAKLEMTCQKCGASTTVDEHCDRPTVSYDRRPVNVVELFEDVRSRLGFFPEEVKGVRGLSNAMKIPERLEKGFLRSKHGIYVFRDGTSRFDATDVTLTHFIPDEIGTPVERLKELGYEEDYLGKPLVSGDQQVPLKHQDVLLSDSGADYFFRVAQFIDEMLVNLYGLKPFYNVKSKEDLVGHLAVGLSPHTSAGALCRIIGFTRANVGYAHPYFHTVKRRNCDGDEDCLIMLMDALINFSRKYLNEKRGGTMDAPLVLSLEVNPKEVDDEVYCMEFVSSYPLEFYQAAERIVPPSEVKLKTVKDVLGKPEQYGGLPLTHPGGLQDKGVIRTKYVQLESIPEKIEAEFSLQGRIRAVDSRDAAERLIMNHFVPDLYGNLRSHSRQTFRCVSCNTIYRRPPLAGKCSKCGGNLLLTINKGGIEKYLHIARGVADRYNLPDYLKQRLKLFEKELKSIFEDDKIKQTGLADFL